ncbi:hypothetical protein WUBG_04247, partial [Wuchereria bancrofti]
MNFRGATKSDRTSALLLAIVLVFLIAEMPQGIIAIMNAIYTTHVHVYIYFNLGDILDLLSLLNSSITFVLYCLMSSRYRDTFWTVVLPKHFFQVCYIPFHTWFLKNLFLSLFLKKYRNSRYVSN